MFAGKKVAAVVVAAGSSSRMGFDKMMALWQGKPVLWHTLQVMESHPMIDTIVVVAGANRHKVKNMMGQMNLQKPAQLVVGGDTRTASVRAGVQAAEDAELVAIHDGARPFVSHVVIARAIQAAAEVGAAAPAVPVKDTIKYVEDGMVKSTPPRSALAAVQTPQVFARGTFLRELDTIPQEEYPLLTDDCMVMERVGLPVQLVEGEYANRKITTIEDLYPNREDNQ